MTPAISAKDIAERLSAQVEAVCHWLLPNGKEVGGEWCVGDVGGGEGRSLKVRVAGAKAGVWCDFSSSQDKGDLLDLIAAVRGCGIGPAIREAKEFLGIREFESITPKKSYSKPPAKIPGVKKLKPESAVMAYLTVDRSIPQSVVEKFRVADGGHEIAFPSYSSEGELLSVKYIGLERDAKGKKVIRQEKGCAPALFGWQAFPSNSREVLITEGQIDAMTWAHIGVPALSVPNGTGDLDGWIDFEWENLQQFDTINLNFDSDKAGQEAVAAVSKRLGTHRCLNVRFDGFKDANEAWTKTGNDKAFAAALKSRKPFMPEQIKSPVDFRDEVMREFFPDGGVQLGFSPETLDCKIRFLPGQLTVWTGISSHGKSNILNQVCVEALKQGKKFAIASMEMPGRKNLVRMIRTSAPSHVKEMTSDYIDSFLSFATGKLWIYDLLGSKPLSLLLELMAYSVARHRVDHFVIDSLMKTDVDCEDREAQRVAMNLLTTFAMDHQVHLHVVCHARKGNDEASAPGKMDVSGSGDILNQSDNLIAVWRNKAKEEEVEEDGGPTPETDGKPDCICYIRKNRETGEEGKARLWFNIRRNRYMAKTKLGDFMQLNLMP